MGEEVLQLAEKNIPAAAWLKDTFKLTGDEYERMQEKGQISLKALEMAIEQHARKIKIANRSFDHRVARPTGGPATDGRAASSHHGSLLARAVCPGDPDQAQVRQ